jgi:hypothetical protein
VVVRGWIKISRDRDAGKWFVKEDRLLHEP